MKARFSGVSAAIAGRVTPKGILYLYAMRTFLPFILTAFLLLFPQRSEAFFGLLDYLSRSLGEVTEMSCNPYTDNPSHPEYCINKGILKPEDMEVKAYYDVFGINEFRDTETMKLGDKQNFHDGLIVMRFVQEGDEGCVYAYSIGVRQKVRFDEALIESFGLSGAGKRHISRQHCMLLPNPDIGPNGREKLKPEVSPLISPVCIYGCDKPPTGVAARGGGEFACNTFNSLTAGEEYRHFYQPAMSVAMQCLTETMYNMIDPAADDSVLTRVQENFRPYILAMLALYIVLNGLKYATGTEYSGRPSGQKFIMLFLKPILIYALASGPYVGQLYDGFLAFQTALPQIISGSNDGSLTMDALDAFENIELVQSSVPELSDEDAFDPRDVSYDACNFGAGGFNYDNYVYTTPAGNEAPLIPGFLQLWDIIDCKFNQYIGSGYYDIKHRAFSTRATDDTTRTRTFMPALLTYGIAFFWKPGVGTVIMVFSIVMFVMIIVVFGRIFALVATQVVIAAISFILAPLLIPMALTEFTKNAFTVWWSTLLSTMLMPAIALIFLTVSLVFVDAVFYGDNLTFNGFGNADICASGKQIEPGGAGDPNKITLVAEDGGCECEDSSALACLLTRHLRMGVLHLDFFIVEIPVYTVDVLGAMGSKTLISEYGKMTGVMILLTYMVTMVQTLMQTLTSASAYNLPKVLSGNAFQPAGGAEKAYDGAKALATPTMLLGAAGAGGAAGLLRGGARAGYAAFSKRGTPSAARQAGGDAAGGSSSAPAPKAVRKSNNNVLRGGRGGRGGGSESSGGSDGGSSGGST